jgi:hypothetical protein
MLLVVKNHTFPPFDGITNTITLANIMANHKTHSLRQNKICILHHSPQKMPREKQPTIGTHAF